MESVLLATKIRIPPRPHQAVHRARLIDALARGIPRARLTLLSAPAGYGKTSLLAEWAHASHCPVAWLTIGEEDNDLDRFLRCLLASWAVVAPGVMDSPAGLLLGGIAPDRDAVLSALLSVANGVPDHLVFVIDDYHLIEEPSIQAALTFLLDHLPPTLHVVLAGRAEPPLPLARYRARQELLELRTEDLHFSVPETEDLLNRLMGLDLPRDEIAPLHAQLEGWIAGLRLAALTLRRHREVTGTLVVSGRHRFIADYLSEEVLAGLTEEARLFLLHTSILDRLCGPLCDAVTGTNDAQSMLEWLERENLFLVPLDDHREWFRFHRLFADFLRGELHRRHSDDVFPLHRRAAWWYLAHDMPDPAFRHAVAGEDVDLVARIADRYLAAKLFGGEMRLVQRWLDLIPAAWYASHPELGLAQAGVLLFTGQFDACARCLDDIERRLVPVEREDVRGRRARVTALRCFIACFHNDLARAEAYADQALLDLPEEACSLRADIYQSLGETYRGRGRWEDARAFYLKALDYPPEPASRLRSVHVFGALADLDLRQGHLRGAAAYWRKALTVFQDQESWGRYPLPVIGWVYIRLGEVLYEWNELADAWDHLARGLERAELGGDARALIAGYLLAGRLTLTEGNVESAAEYLERARPLVEQAPFPEWIGRFERLQLELWLAQGRLRAAVDWSDQMQLSSALESRPEPEMAQLANARVLIVRGDGPALDHAVALLGRLLGAAEVEGRTGVQIEALALQALAHWQRGERAGALTALERALRLAESEGYVRLFADFGLPMAWLLREARARAVMPDYVARLLSAIGGDRELPAPAAGLLPEPLTGREQEILELVAAGLTNREIADKLIISPETVKKHTGTIYGKLGVGNRTEAAARARDLHLLG